MSKQREQLQQRLDQIEDCLKRLALWQATPPEPEAFANDTPFHADSMPLEAWLQWVLLPRFRALLDADSPLPSRCATAPMAEQVWQDQLTQMQPLIELLGELDTLITNP